MTGPGLGDQLFLDAYAPGETVPATEPASYSIVGRPTEDISSTLNILSISSNAFVELDEIRVGETWADVAAVPEPSVGILFAFAATAAAQRRAKKP